MANNQESYEHQGNAMGSLLKSAVGLAPLGYGIHKMMGAVSANAALNPAVPLGVGQGSGGRLPDVGRRIGQKLGAASKDLHASDLKRLDTLTKQLMEDDGLNAMFSVIEERNALTQALLETIDDPTSGLDNSTLMGYRDKLVNLSQNNLSTDELKETVQQLVQAVLKTTPEDTQIRFSKNLREYKKLGPHLVPPAMDPKNPSNSLFKAQPLTAVEPSSLVGDAKKRYEGLVKGLGGQGNRVSVVQKVWDGIPQYYARVYSGGAGRSGYLDTVPLQLGYGKSGFNAVFTGENLSTGYAAPRHFLDATRANSALGQAGVHTAQSVIASSGIATEDLFIQNLLGRMSDKNGPMGMSGREARAGRDWYRQLMTVMPRSQYSIDNPGANHHLNRVMEQATNFAYVVGMDKLDPKAREALMLKLGSETPGFEANAPSNQFLARGLNNEDFGRIGMMERSALSSIKSIGSATRGYFPLESRIEQVFHQPEGSMFVTGRARTMGRGRTMGAGANATSSGSVINHLDRNIEWAETLTGSTNKAVLMPTKGKLYDALEGTGSAYTTGKEKMRMFATKPILDPGAKGYRASKLFMDEILYETITAADGSTSKRMRAEGEMVRLSREQIKKHGSFLGFGADGTQFLHMDPRMNDMHVAYTITEANKKQTINLTMMVERDMEIWKGFSTLHKGGVESLSPTTFMRNLSDVGWTAKDSRRLNINHRDLLIADPSMLKKGAGFFDLQMRSGYGLVSGDKNYHRTLQRLAETQQFSVLGDSTLAKTTGAVLKGLSTGVQSGKISPRDAGFVLGGIHEWGGTEIKGQNASQAIKQTDLQAAMKQAFGSRYQEVLTTAQTGLALGATSMSQGQGPGDWKLGRGSVEPRFITNLQHRLKNMGMSTDAAADVIAGVYKNKMGFAQHIKAAYGLGRLGEGITGTAGVLEGAAQLNSGLKTYNLQDIKTLGAGDEGFSELLQKHPDGFLLDLTSGADTTARRAIASNAQDVFGSAGPIYIPGRDVADAMKDTFIKQSRDMAGRAGDELVHGEYTEMMNHLFKGLASAESKTLTAADDSRQVLEHFKTTGLDLWSRAAHGVTRGKVKGSISGFARQYDLNQATNFSSNRTADLAKGLFKRTKGQAVFMDSKLFLSQLNDWMGNQNGAGATRDAAKKAEMFFLSSAEALRTGDLGKAKGVVQIGTRHPQVGLGNITPMQVFRHVEELGRNTDLDTALFSHMKGVSNKYGNVKNWSHVAGMGAGDRLGFFTDLVSNLPEIAPDGGGSLFIPRHIAGIGVTGAANGKSTMSVDFGISAAAIGDFDGDQWLAMMINQESGKSIMSTLGKGSDEWLKADTLYKIKSHVFAEEAKAGLMKHNANREIGFESPARIKESLLKEQAAKAKVGSLDVQLTRMRSALLDLNLNGKVERGAIDEALALLKIVQEHAVIKSKKLPIFLPFADMLTNAIKVGFDSGNISEVDRVMREYIFKGSKLLDDEGVTINSVNSHLPWADTISNEKMTLKPIIGLMGQALQTARVTKISEDPSAYWMAKHLSSDALPEEVAHHMALLQAGQTLESSVIQGAQPKTGKQIAAGAENMMHRIGSSLDMLDKKTMGIAAAALAGSMALMGLVGHQGYSPTPMMVTGETISPDVRAAIGRGDAFTPNPDSMRQGQSGMVGARPNMTPTAYLQGPNAYQVRGNVSDMRGMTQANNFMGQLPGGSRGSITVQDNRRPITNGYIDRMMGSY